MVEGDILFYLVTLSLVIRHSNNYAIILFFVNLVQSFFFPYYLLLEQHTLLALPLHYNI